MGKAQEHRTWSEASSFLIQFLTHCVAGLLFWQLKKWKHQKASILSNDGSQKDTHNNYEHKNQKNFSKTVKLKKKFYGTKISNKI